MPLGFDRATGACTWKTTPLYTKPSDVLLCFITFVLVPLLALGVRDILGLVPSWLQLRSLVLLPHYRSVTSLLDPGTCGVHASFASGTKFTSAMLLDGCPSSFKTARRACFHTQVWTGSERSIVRLGPDAYGPRCACRTLLVAIVANIISTLCRLITRLSDSDNVDRNEPQSGEFV